MSTIASARLQDHAPVPSAPVELVIPDYQVDLLREVVGKASNPHLPYIEQRYAAFELVGVVQHLLATRLP